LLLAVCCSLTGHRSNCLAIEFSSLDESSNFFVTGSLDTNAKVWDLRRKDCIATYKGHSSGVRKLAVSPDNKWVCSGSESGEIKVCGSHSWTLQPACSVRLLSSV
jgi:katanin p80 WD40 repeat-containing subunit B1